MLGEEVGKPGHGRLIGDVDLQRRDGDAVILQRRDIRAMFGLDGVLDRIGNPVIGVAAAIHALVDMQPFLPPPPERRHRDAFNLFGPAVRESMLISTSLRTPRARMRRIMSGA